MAAKLINIEIIQKDITCDSVEIRLDWDNDRHQQIALRGDSPHDALAFFERITNVIRAEIYRNEI